MAKKAYIDLQFVFIMKRDYLLYFFIILAFLILGSISSKSITGTVIADFEDKTFEEGEIITGSLTIDVGEENLPLSSLIQIRLGDQVEEIPLFELINEFQESRISDIEYYPAVELDLSLLAVEKVQLSPSIIDYFTGRITEVDSGVTGKSIGISQEPETDPVSEVKSGGGGSKKVIGEEIDVGVVSVYSGGSGSVSFEDLDVIDVIVKEVRLLDETVIDKDLIEVEVIDNEVVSFKSNYKEKLKGFKQGELIEFPLSIFKMRAQSGEMAVAIKHFRGDSIRSSRLYVPFEEDKQISVGDAEKELIEFVGAGKDCGKTICRIEECVSANVDSGEILKGEVQDSLVTRVACSNSCLTEEKVTSCEREKTEKIVRSKDAENKIEIINEEGEPIAKLEIKEDRLDIIFSQS